MIHARVTRKPSINSQDPESTGPIDGIHISITAESIPNFQRLVDRALNCWNSAPAELKELGDMLTHGRVTQDHARK